MSKVQLQDIVSRPEFAEAVDSVFPEESQFIRSGVVEDGALGVKIADKALTYEVPYYPEIADETPGTSDDEIIASNGDALVPRKFGQRSCSGVTLVRGKAFEFHDLARIYAGKNTNGDPVDFLARRIASYQARQEQYVLMAQMNGIFGQNASKVPADGRGDAGDLIYDISSNTGDAAYLSRNSVVWATSKLGSSRNVLGAIVCHSLFAIELSILDKAAWEPASENNGFIAKYCGMNVIEDDSLPYDKANRVTTAYLFGPAAFARQRMDIDKPLEQYREALASKEGVIRRWRMLLHPRGFSWVGTAAKETPSNVELATATNWKQEYMTKQMRILKMSCKLRSNDFEPSISVRLADVPSVQIANDESNPIPVVDLTGTP